MRLFIIVWFGFAVPCAASTDYRQITTYTGPCARALAVMAKEGDIQSAREQARALCRSGAAASCPDLWLVYAYCEIELNEPGALAVSEEVVNRQPKSAAAHMTHALATMKAVESDGVFRALARFRAARRALERALECDPDCHPARATLILFYSLPKVLGGDPAKLKFHLEELDQRDPFHAALCRGSLEVRRKNYPAAVAHYRAARRLDPSDQDPVSLLIDVSVVTGDYTEAFALCAELIPAFSGDGRGQEKFIELSAQSLLHTEDALTASGKYLATAKGVTPEKRAKVLAHTAVILQHLGRIDEAQERTAEARRQWAGVGEHLQKFEKKYHGERPVVATR